MSALTTQRILPYPYAIVPLAFSRTQLAANQAGTPLVVQQVYNAGPQTLANATASYVMPWPGRVIAVAAAVSGALTGGLVTVKATVNGVPAADPAAEIGVGHTSGSDLVASRETVPFAAGAEIGAAVTTTAGYSPTTSDLHVTVWVLLDCTGL